MNSENRMSSGTAFIEFMLSDGFVIFSLK